MSSRSGMGKSLYVQRTAERLKEQVGSAEDVCVTIPIHGPTITPDSVLTFLAHHLENSKCMIYHLDVAPSVRIFSKNSLPSLMFTVLVY